MGETGGRYLSDLEFTFNYPGIYDIYYKNTVINTVTVHRAPVASFDVDLSNPEHPIFTDTSYDPDDLTAGIVDSVFTWIDVGTMTTPLPGLPDTLENDHLYLITLTVTDKLGAVGTVARQISATTGEPRDGLPKNPPYAAFALTPATIMKGVGNQSVSLSNGSYDLYGADILSSFLVKRDGVDFDGWMLTGNGNGSYDTAALGLPVGSYRVYLTGESENGVSPSPGRSATSWSTPAPVGLYTAPPKRRRPTRATIP